MKVATFNINNINKRRQNLLAWLAASKPDVVCLQELKSAQADFPVESLRNIGYEAVWCGQRSWSGVAILARGQVPVLTRSSLPGDAADLQARYIEAAVNGILFTSIYLPNGVRICPLMQSSSCAMIWMQCFNKFDPSDTSALLSSSA